MSLSKTLNSPKVLVIPRKRWLGPDMTEKNVDSFPHFSVAPKMDQQPDGPFYNWKENNDGHLPCVASANPLPVFRWLRDDGNTEITSADPFYSIVREEHRSDPVKYPQIEKEKFTVTSKLMVRPEKLSIFGFTGGQKPCLINIILYHSVGSKVCKERIHHALSN